MLKTVMPSAAENGKVFEEKSTRIWQC